MFLKAIVRQAKLGIIGTLRNVVARGAALQTALPSVGLGRALEGGGAKGRRVRQTESFDIFMVPEGNGDMATIRAKKSEVNTVFRKISDSSPPCKRRQNFSLADSYCSAKSEPLTDLSTCPRQR